ncbi:MAG: Isochorismatase family protein [Burkholderia sp.]|jgi:nicotinamidase-related amidase
MPKTCVLVVDMIRGFAEKGALADPSIAAIAPAVRKRVLAADAAVFLCDRHTEGCPEFDAFPVHCLAGSEESEVIPALADLAGPGNTVGKQSTNGFFALDKEKLARFDEIVVTGCCTDICVLQLALTLKAWFNERGLRKRIAVPRDAVATYDAPGHPKEKYAEAALALMKNAGIAVE